MKHKTALRQSRSSIKFLLILVSLLAAATIWRPSRYTAIPLGLAILGLLGDAYNVRYIQRKAARNPTFLDEHID